MLKTTHRFPLLIVLISLPLLVFANAGSPLVWFGVFHLFIANAGIGVWESCIMEKKGFRNRVWVIIIANYVSMLAGYFLIAPFVIHQPYGRDPDHFDVGLSFLISFLATLLIEYPLFRGSLKNKGQRAALLKPFLLANIRTNVVMLALYLFFT